MQVGKYSDAVDIVNNLIKLIENEMVTALLHRSYTMEKLGYLGPSIEDARRVVQLSPHMSVGYLQQMYCGSRARHAKR